MEGCPACDHYVPRLTAHARELKVHGYPFVVHEMGEKIPAGSIPIALYDAASEDPDVQKLADRFEVTATPTTIVLSRGGSFKIEGSIADNQILWLLNMANEENQ